MRLLYLKVAKVIDPMPLKFLQEEILLVPVTKDLSLPHGLLPLSLPGPLLAVTYHSSGQLAGYERAQCEREGGPQLGDPWVWPGKYPLLLQFIRFSLSSESQDTGWQDLPQQSWRLNGGPAEAHVGVGPWGL